MIPKIIIGIGHRSGVGKDTLAKFLDGQLRVNSPGKIIRKQSFAWKLKEVAYDLYGWAGVQPPIHYENCREDRDLPLSALGGITVVDLWVKLGTDGIRDNVYERTWIDYLLKGNKDHIDVLIIPDVRFPDEAESIQELGGKLIRVDNPNVPHRKGKSVDHKLAGWGNWYDVFVNCGDLRDLMNYAEQVSKNIIQEMDSDGTS